MFHLQAAPFCDYCAVVVTSDRQKRFGSLRAEMDRLGFDMHRQGGGDSSFVALFLPKGRTVGAGAQLLLEGYSFSDAPPGAADGDVERTYRSPNGHCTIIRRTDDELIFSTDNLGLSQLYYSDRLIQLVSNRIELAFTVRRGLSSTSPRMDAEVGARVFAYASPFWGNTIVQGIRLLPLGHEIVLTPSRVQLRQVVNSDASISGYSSLINRAADEIVGNVRSAVQQSAGLDRIVSLSGGIDCRVLLAGIIAAGHTADFQYYTYGTAGSPDRVVAANLRARFKLEQVNRRPPERRSEAAVLDRGFSFNWCMRTIAGDGYVDAEPRNELVLNGGCGENFRGYFSQHMIAKVGDDAFNLADHEAAEQFIAQHCTKFHLTPGAYEVVAARVRKTISSFGRQEPLTKIDLLYPHYRNRYHFGLGARVRASSSLTMSPVNTPSAYEASLLVTAYDRCHGKVAYDLIQALEPDLNRTPTTAGFWNPSFAADQTYRPLQDHADLRPNGKRLIPLDLTRASAEDLIRSLDALADDGRKLEELGRIVTHKKLRKAALAVTAGEQTMKQSRLIQYMQFFRAALKLEVAT